MSDNNDAMDGFIKELDAWDPTKYTGPGAVLADAEQNDAKTLMEKPYLVLKSSESDFNQNTIRSILKNVSIKAVRHPKHTNLYFIDFNSIADLEESIRTLERIGLNCKVQVGQPKKREEFAVPFQADETKKLGNLMTPNVIDMDSRAIKISPKNPVHPIFKREPLVNALQYSTKGSLMTYNDPKGRYARATDEHVLERDNIFQLAKLPIDNMSQVVSRAGRTKLSFTEDVENQFSKNILDIVQSEVHDEMLRKFDFRPCSACGKLCNIHCSHCSAPFCDAACEQKLHAEHTQACALKVSVKHKALAMTQKTEEHNMWKEYMPPSGAKVILTAFQSSNVVCVRSVSDRDNNAYFGIIEQVNAEGKKAKKLIQAPKCGELVILQITDEYLRAIVLNVDDLDAINLVCIDYGNLEVQPLANLFELKNSLAELPRYAVPVRLNGVPNCFMRLQYRKFLYSYLNNHKLKMKYNKTDYAFTGGLYIVELFDDILHMSLNKCASSLCTPIEPSLSDEIFFKGSLEEAKLPIGSNVSLLVMDNSLIKYGLISCSTKEYALEIEKYQLDIQAYGNSTSTECYAPQVNELCIAKYESDGQWCRGNCLERVGDGFPTIHFVDYGNVSLVSVDQIRRYPEIFVYPILTLDVELNDMPTECDDEQMTILESQFAIGSIINCDLTYNSNENAYYLKNPTS